MSYLLWILALLLLVFVHELGHFAVARWTGAKATRFLVGFPPVAVSFHRGETEYGLGAIPLGGYVRIVGMNRPAPDDLIICQDAIEEIDLRRPEGQRDLLRPTVAALRAAVADGAAPGECQTLADRAILALDADQHLLHPKTYKETRKDLERLRDDLDRRAYWRLPVWRRIAIILAGPGANVLAALVILTAFFALHGQPNPPKVEPVVAAVTAGMPAAQAGLQVGDRIVSVNGTAVDGDYVKAQQAIQDAKGGLVTVIVARDGVERTLAPVRPVEQEGAWRVGVQFQATAVPSTPLTIPQAAGQALSWSWTIARDSVLGLFRIFTTSDGHKQVSSIVGITQAGAQSVDSGGFLWLLGLVSLALAIFNLLPFLPLDGGHVVVALAEKLRRGKPLSRVLIERISIVGIALVLLLFAIGLNNDISRFTGP